MKKQWMSSALRRAAAAVLSAAMAWGMAAPVSTVWADTPEGVGADDLFVSRTVLGESGQTMEMLRDGDTIPAFNASDDFGEFTLCRGDTNAPVSKQDVSVSLISHATGEQIPAEAFWTAEQNDHYAVYRFWPGFGQPAADYFGSISPEFGFDIVFAVGEEKLTLHVPNDGVTVDVDGMQETLSVRRLGFENYLLDFGYVYVSSDAMKNVDANMSWIVSAASLTGEIADYFTVGELAHEGLYLTATEALNGLTDHQTVTGELHYTGKLDNQQHAVQVEYTKADLHADWYQPTGQSGNDWWSDSYLRLSVGDKGSVRLRLYPSSASPSAGGQPIGLSDEALTLDLPEGMTAQVQDDDVTLMLTYDITAADVREQQYSIVSAIPGVSPAWLTIEINEAARYQIGRLAGGKYYYFDSATIAYPEHMTTLLENYAVVPLVNGIPAATKEELESCALSVGDAEHPGTLTQTARKIRYEDKNGNVSEVWAWCVMPTVQNADGTEIRTMSIYDAGGQVLGRMSYTVSGLSLGGGIALKADRMETLTVQPVASTGTMPYNVQDADGSALVLTEPPVVTGDAAQNLNVVWAEGLSGVRIDLNADQIPGTATVELRAGDTVRRILYTFLLFEESATYYSTGVDFYRRPYNETLSLTENLTSLSAGSVSPVNTTRFAEDGSFALYVYSRQYISDQQFDTADHLGAKYSFASELVKSIEFYTSDEEILSINGEITQTDATDPVFAGNGYANPDGKCFGVMLTPGGKTGTCDVYAVIELNRPSLNDPFGCDMTKTPERVSIGHTFTVTSSDESDTVTAAPETLQSVLDSLTITSQPVVVLLEGGTYAMDLNLDGKNVILRSADAEDPAVFTGAPDAEGGYIITVNAPSASFALENIILDGGNTRGGILQQSTGGQPAKSFTVRGCTIRNCTTGFSGTFDSNCTLRDTVIEHCDVGATGCILLFCTLKNNTCAAWEEYYSNIHQSVSARWSRFADNGTDYEIAADAAGAPEYTLTLQQNYWNGASGPSVRVISRQDGAELTGKTVHVYASPYYTTEALDRLNIDLATTQIENGTLILPLEKSGTDEGGMLMSADAFAAIQQSNAPASFPIKDEKSMQIAQWEFGAISNASIDTDLDVDDELSEQAQAAVDKLPQADQDKILQEVNLSHNGELPGRATLRIKAGEVPADSADKLCLYWVKPDGAVVPAEVIDVTYDPADECYVITVDHCSEYVITSGELTDEDSSEPDDSAPGEPGNKPETSDNQPGGAAGGTSSASSASGSSTAPAESRLYSAQMVMDAFREQTGGVTISVAQRSAVSQTAFALLKERAGASLRLQGEGFAWTFEANEIEMTQLPGGVFDAAVTFGVSEADAARIEAFADERPWFGFETAHSGALPGPATLEITLHDPALAGMRCGVYWLPESGDAERIGTVDVDAGGTAVLHLEHCSVYFLVAEEKSTDTTEPDSAVQQNSPETDTQPKEFAEPQSGIHPAVIGTIAALCAATAVTGFFLWRRTRK